MYQKETWWERHPFLAITGAILALLAVGGIAWSVKVALAPVKGAGDVIIEQNKATTRIGSQEELQERYNGIKALDAVIGTYATLAAHPDADKYDKINLAGAKNACNTAIAEYEAMTHKVTAEKWVGDLPYLIDRGNPETDCKAEGN